jgi:hypothetical protein
VEISFPKVKFNINRPKAINSKTFHLISINYEYILITLLQLVYILKIGTSKEVLFKEIRHFYSQKKKKKKKRDPPLVCTTHLEHHSSTHSSHKPVALITQTLLF